MRLKPPPVNLLSVARASCARTSGGCEFAARRTSRACCSRFFCSKYFFLTSRSSFWIREISYLLHQVVN